MPVEATLPLPEYDDPPVIETVLGVAFEPLAHWSLPHYGLFWSEIRSEYPRFNVQPPVPSAIEDFDPPAARKPPAIAIQMFGPGFGTSFGPPARCWFIHTSGNRLIQLQNDRFLFNWRKAEPSEKYPRYDTIRPAFEAEWDRFCRFLSAWDMPPPQIKQWEVTYINHLEKGKGWSDFSELNRVARNWCGNNCEEFLASPEDVSITARYRIARGAGRLTIELQPAIRIQDAEEILQLALVARGRPSGHSKGDILAGLDVGREAIVVGFDCFTTPEMHSIWGRKERS
jgi:uncharacterized protein (TIGR04255 family)